MKTILLYTSIFFAYYVLGAYATTDILRLLHGTTIPVNAPDCRCPVCHKKIALWDQLPIFSYLKNCGSCKNCGSRIPLPDLFLEVFLFALLSVVTIITHFSWLSFGLCILIYEAVKLIFIIRFGKREEAFRKNLLISLLNNVLLFSIIAFLFALKHLL